MALKIKQSLENLIDDLASIQVATVHQQDNKDICVGYTKISIEGDTINYIDTNAEKVYKDTHLAAINQSIRNRDAMLKFIITTLKSL